MADQKNRGGQKQGNQQPKQPEQKQGTSTQGTGMLEPGQAGGSKEQP